MIGRSVWSAPDGSHAVIQFDYPDGSYLGDYTVRLEQMSYSDDPEYFRQVFAPGRRFFDVFKPTPKKPLLTAEDLVMLRQMGIRL
jgi:hypothetical protein